MIPTLEELKEHFKDVKIVKCAFAKTETKISENIIEDVSFHNGDYWVRIKDNPKGYICLWCKFNKYAEIVEYKEPETVKPRFSVSLVYRKKEGDAVKTALKCIITNAVSEEEALGIAIKEYENETINWDLTIKAVIKFD